MPQVNAATVFLLLVALLVAGWLAGLLRVRYEEGRLTASFRGSPRVALRFDLRDLWALLAFALVLGWAVAGAVEHSEWVPDTGGRLVPAMAFATAAGFLFAALRFSRLGFVLASVPAILLGLVLFTPSPLTNAPSIPALTKWVSDLPGDSNLQVLIGFLLMCLVSGLWTSWWLFVRKNGLVALLPTGTILAVEIINDTSLGLIFYTLVWLAAAACLLLRINFVTLKQSWRRRRLPHASDTAWTFGEIGAEATAAILAVAFILPPLSNADISGALIPAVVRPDSLHPFGFGAPGSSGSIGTIGYSDVVRPGSQLKAKSETVMVVTGDTPLNSPYWRGIALGGWDGIQWYPLPSTPDVPVRVQPQVRSGATIPRDDLPADPTHSTVLQNTFRVLVPQDQTKGAIFTAGEARSVRSLNISVQGIMTSVPGPPGGAAPSLVNVPGDNAPPATFDTIDRMQLTHSVTPPYFYTVSEVVPNADIADLQSAGTDYPAWISPYTTLYYGGRVSSGFSTNRDAEILALARSIVNDAHATTPYDQAKAIESWFRQKDRFSYTLLPPRAPAGVRPLDYFLFTSKKGFCQDFSTAMNVMLRMLGIPSRQMSGFGLGSYDDKLRQYDVNSLDAHSWVEVYFPGYGWIPFEPTPDNSNFPISLPANRNQLDSGTTASAAATPRVRPNVKEPGNDANVNSSAGSPFPDLTRPLLIAAGVLLLLLLLGLLFALRWLFGARDLPRIWNRLLFLADRLKVPRRSGDTPVEFGGRLSGSMPELEAEVRRLSALYTRASFRRGGLSPDELAEARQVWLRVRARYAGLVARAWRDALRQGRVVSAAAAEASENPKAAAPR